MLKLFIGDAGEYLSWLAIDHDHSAFLVDKANVSQLLSNPTGTAYTSIADVDDLKVFLDLCSSATEIFYCPPDQWSDGVESKQKEWTEGILSYVSQTVLVHGLDLDDNMYKFLVGIPGPCDSRKTDAPQLWAAGCSITYGIGVEEEQTWKYHVAKKLKLEYSNLSHPGSSILWQSYQICQSDIRRGDLVFWGQTAHQRIPVVDTKTFELTHLYQSQYQEKPELVEQYPPEILLSPALIYHNVMAIKNVCNFCQQVGAKLVILGLLYDWDLVYKFYKIPMFKQYLVWPNKFVDFGTDGRHPGPQQHLLFAEEFVKVYNQLYNTNDGIDTTKLSS